MTRSDLDLDISMNRPLPQNVEAEVAVLGAILLENGALGEIRSIIGIDDFFSERNRIIFQAFCAIAASGKPIDSIILSAYLTGRGELKKVGGIAYIAELMDSTASAANVAHHCRIVKEKANLRGLINAAVEAADMAYSANGSGVGPILEVVKKRIDQIEVDKTTDIQAINASAWLQTDPPAPDQILEDTFDAGDKLAIISSSKLFKSFLALQMALSIAAGRNFLTWRVTRPRRVLYAQFEIKDDHFHRRTKRMARATGIGTADLGDRLHIINARGMGISGPAGIERIQKVAMDFHPEVIFFDPLYKLATGVENAAEDAKVILNAFDVLAEKTGAAIVYIHHDAKGSPGDRDIRDRGAGSNVLGRDYDACFTLTPHASDPDATVIDVLLRNYRPQEPFTIIWNVDESGGYRFETSAGILPEKKTSKTKATQPPLSIYLPIAASILGNDETEVGPFKTAFKTQTGLSDHRIRDFLAWATAGGNPHLLTREERGRGLYKKLIKARVGMNDGE
jgi:hypothetical protein